MFDCVVSAWRAHGTELAGFLARQIADRHLAQDLLQEVFLRAVRQGQGFCAIRQPRAWLFQVARNALIDHARTTRRWVPLPEDLTAPAPVAREPVDELDVCIGQALERLTPADRAILVACDLQGQTVRVYAQAAGLGLPAAKSRLLRARQRLREALMAECEVQLDEAGRVCCHRPCDPAAAERLQPAASPQPGQALA
ncbi:sigma-70 family RNA polymerase sigma factor [Immundisolibacter sp.]